MTDHSPLERRYRRWLALYPKSFRAEREDEMVAVLIQGADPDQTRPRAREAANLATHGLRRRAGGRRFPSNWQRAHAALEQTDVGTVPTTPGWFVLNAREQEDFLVLSGEAVLIVEGQERSLRQWDFVHCPPESRHAFVGAGTGPCVLLCPALASFSSTGRGATTAQIPSLSATTLPRPQTRRTPSLLTRGSLRVSTRATRAGSCLSSPDFSLSRAT